MAKKKKAKLGRPRLPASEKRTGRFLIKLTDAEEQLIREAAGEERVLTWARETLLRAAKRRLKT